MYGGNIGSVCRAMKNMRLSRLVLVEPQASVDWKEARTMAVNADDILNQRVDVATLAEAVNDCVQVAGTTNREGVYRLHAAPPRDWAPAFIESAAAAPVAVIFGPEQSGLTNEDLAFCTQIVRIPTSPEYGSLNLAQAVLIVCYELFLIKGNYQPPGEKHGEATLEQRERMVAMWEDMLWKVGFFDEQKAEHMMMAVRRIFSRGKLSESDVNILMGIARQAQWAAKH
jgi:tRNA/rRNA methyltransferase